VKNETMEELKARLYPAYEVTCYVCKRENNAGEYFAMESGLSLNRLCPECKTADEKRIKREQAILYSSGEDTPCSTDEITCPWCGYEDGNSGECDDSDDEYECGQCGGIFSYERDVIVTYSSERVSPPEPDKEDKEA